MIRSLRGTPLSVRQRFHCLPIVLLFIAAAFRLAMAGNLELDSTRCGLTSVEAIRFNGDASADIHALSDYRDSAYGLLKAKQFKKLECIAGQARSGKETFPGGFWKLHAIYSGLSRPPLHATSVDWMTHIELLRQWRMTRPQSITARIALAEAYINYGADARGTGFADTVSESGWKLMEERTAKAKRILDLASTLPTKDPEWYLAMQSIALGKWELEARQALLEKAVKFEPAYYYYYRLHANSIQPKWGGSEGDVARFLKSTADGIGGDAGDALYFRVAATLVCGCETDQKLNLSWPRIQKGFDAIEKHDGAGPTNWNLLAHLAQSFNDAFVAQKMFTRIGDQWDEDTWQEYSAFESTKQWAEQMGPMMARKHAAEEPAEANLQTSEGQQYKVALDEKLNIMAQACKDQSSGGDPGNYELLVKVGKEGTIEDMMGVGSNRAGFCLAEKLAEARQNKQVVLPPPPQPAYWIRFDLNSEDPAAAALK